MSVLTPVLIVGGMLAALYPFYRWWDSHGPR
jgi:hypothetical protein